VSTKLKLGLVGFAPSFREHYPDLPIVLARVTRSGYISDDFFTNAYGHPGVDVMITSFCDFSKFFCEKIGVFLKYQCYVLIFLKI
jgi:hypothetical protein